jgi:hypothetical protein
MLLKPCATTLGLLLAHHLPKVNLIALHLDRLLTFVKVRTDTAECLYTILQTNDFEFDVEGAEAILLETEWYGVLLRY